MSILYKNKQQGVALVVSLIMLLIMSLLAVSSMNTTVLEEKMAGNYKDRNMAFQAGEAGLRAGEFYIKNTSPLPDFDGTTAGLYQPTLTGAARWDIVNWDATGEFATYTGSLTDIPSAPKFIIEEIPDFVELGESLDPTKVKTIKYYRITTVAKGGTDAAIVMLQSTYKHQY